MFKLKRDKLTVHATRENPPQEKPFVQMEGQLTREQLEKIAAGALSLN